ncbi:hypothetical protein [Pseudonocardia hierapolitana]|uniref:hypothetical protein n=1 Tax=Pseudonocardia hierapolitana TaxID=1128676 RepID=UPI0011BEDFA8|nr:hypothetical protein [Pseudonocardia hierapolitana]
MIGLLESYPSQLDGMGRASVATRVATTSCRTTWPSGSRPGRKTGHAPVASWLHAPTYAATQAATDALFYRTVGVRMLALAQLAGAVTEGVLDAIMAWQ